MELTPSDFAAYFKVVHGVAPFGWQCRLLEQVLQEGWGRPISLPTASGKTAVLDIALFALALQAGLPAVARQTPRRIALVIDRRIVVDDAYRRAERIVSALSHPRDAVLQEVSRALLMLGGEIPVDCAALRGGLYQESRWARTPLQPVLLCSTVDQVGSRLLHRGYGVSPRTWSIHAGLLGHDTLIIVDEAHCAQPFVQTLQAVDTLRRASKEPIPGPWATVSMTATPRDDREPFRLNDAERAEPILQRRLAARKNARVAVARKRGDEGMAEEALAALHDRDARFLRDGATTLVVLNRVRAARILFDALTAGSRGHVPVDAVLLTGRSRPVERDRLVAGRRDRLIAGRNRSTSAGAPPLVVVATQCVEVGADLDADGLITECAPLDSLRQRFGRLDRLGELGDAPARVICRPEYVGVPAEAKLPKDLDPVYGDALTRTYWWLDSVAQAGRVDFGVDAIDALLSRHPPSQNLAAPAREAPYVFPAYCDLWVQTGPMPAVSPDPALFLHGPNAGPADVNIVWRSDLDPREPESWLDVVSVCPPVVGEALPLPLHSARAWLLGAEGDAGSDVEGVPTPEDVEVDASVPRKALLWDGPEISRLVTADLLSPGITLVVPCGWGGADTMGWTGRAADCPDDIMDAARLASRRPATLRLHPSILGSLDMPAELGALATLDCQSPEGLPRESELRSIVSRQLPLWSQTLPQGALAETVSRLVADAESIRVKPHPSGIGLVVSARNRLADQGRDFTDDGDASSLATHGAVPLAVHLDDVRTWAIKIARGVGLPAHLAEAVALAGHLHDLGKADPRFQAWLTGGNLLDVDPARPMAKSDRLLVGQAGAEARRRSGYPAGARHELLSVRLAESAEHLLPCDEGLRDLVLHLVASHHGHCRPWAPVVSETRPLSVRYRHVDTELQASSATGLERLGSGVGDRFWRVVRVHGWWGLSFLEACLRLADHRASEKPGVESGEVAV